VTNTPPESNDHAGEDPLVGLYLARRETMLRFFAARVESRATAEDLVQELYLKIKARPPGAEAENPTALLYRIALNLMLDRSRGAVRGARREAEWSQLTRSRLAGEEVTDEAAPDEAAASRERLRQLVAAVSELPPQMQRAFRLHKLEGLSQAQTAAVMGLSVKSVEKHISAALKNLTGRLRT